MSNHVVQSHDSDGMSGKSINPNQSSWMTHWMQSSYKSVPLAYDHLSRQYKSKEDNEHIKQHPLPVSDTFKSRKGFRQKAEISPVKISNEHTSSNNSKKEIIDRHSFPVFTLSKNGENTFGSKNDQLSICSKGGPFSVHDVEMMRECATVDSVEGITGGPPKCSKTTRHMLFTTKTGINLSEGGQMFRESAASNKFKGKALLNDLILFPDFGSHGRPGLKLQPLDSSTDSEGDRKLWDSKTSAVDSKNESSAETDTMDMDAFKENYHLTDLALSISNKGVENVSSSKLKLSSNSEEVGERFPNTEEPTAQFTAASPMCDEELSSSRTQSLDLDHLLSITGNPASSKSIHSPVGSLEPSSRWTKRLKMSTSDSLADGTKSSKMGEASSHEKVHKFFQMLEGNISPEPASDKHCDREQLMLNQATLLKNDESSAVNSVKKGENDMLSNPWIQRWCRSQVASPQKKLEAVVVCEPQISNAISQDLQKEQFPSIAAMALMGKGQNRSRQWEFRKRGAFVVWNTNEL